MYELALFAGAGGGILAGRMLGWRTICAVEIEPYAAAVLLDRQNTGDLDPFPIWDDVRTFDGRPWGGIIDVISGGFPCQDISPAGRGEGLNGDRSGLWSEFARIIGEVRSRYVFVENSAALSRSGLEIVLGDLASLGYDAEWGVLSAAQVGAPHVRERMWILAYTKEARSQLHRLPLRASQAESLPPESGEYGVWDLSVAPEPLLGGVVDGVAARVDGYRRAALGNGQVPACAATAFSTLVARAAMKSKMLSLR